MIGIYIPQRAGRVPTGGRLVSEAGIQLGHITGLEVPGATDTHPVGKPQTGPFHVELRVVHLLFLRPYYVPGTGLGCQQGRDQINRDPSAPGEPVTCGEGC